MVATSTTPDDERTLRTRARFAAGDPLRGIAALAVAVGHVLGLVVITWQTDGRSIGPPAAGDGFGRVGDLVSALGTAGVSVFFVLSGYLLSRPFVRAFALGADRPSAGTYVRNRIVRIVPAYWALLALVLLLVVVPDRADLTAGDLPGLFLFDESLPASLNLWLGQIWTLAVELRFYALLLVAGTLLVVAGQRLGARLTPAARVAILVGAAVALAAWSFPGHELRSAYFATTFGHTAGRFSAGVLLAVLEVTVAARQLLRLPRATAPAAFAGGAVALCLLAVAYEDPAVPLGQATQWLITLAAGVLVGAPLLWQWSGRPAWRALDNRVLRWAGSRSYSLYLVHFPLYAALLWAFPGDDHRAHVLLLALVGLPLALLAAEVLHRLVERPALRRRAPSQAAPASRAAPTPRAAPAGG